MMKLFVFACLVAFAAAGAISTYSAPLGYAAAPYAYNYGYPYSSLAYSSSAFGYKPLAYTQYSSPLTYQTQYKPGFAYSALGYNNYAYGYNHPYLY